QAREAARRSQCKNNLKQLGLAMHNYHDTHLIFPSGSYHSGTDEESPPQKRHTWVEMLFPFIDQAPLYSKLDFTRRTNDSASPNPDALNGFMASSLMCPSDPNAGLFVNAREANYQPNPLGSTGTVSLGMSYAPSGGPVHTGACTIISNDRNCLGFWGGLNPD